MKEELVSIIIPIYNVESYLSECLESVLKQTYKEIEVILVDDGSKDSSYKIASMYAKKDNRVKLYHQENRGVSSARNVGIKQSNGKYVAFVDADDWVKEKFIEKLVKTIQNADMAIVKYEEKKKSRFELQDGEVEREDFFYDVLCNVHGSCCNRLFLKQIIFNNNIRFDENVFFLEDTLFLMNYYRFCKKVRYCKEVLYHYRYNRKSATNTTQYKKFNMKRITSIALSNNIEKWYINENNFVWKCMVYRRIRSYIILMYQMIICRDFKDEIVSLIKNDLGNYYWDFLLFRKNPLILKGVATAIYISPEIVYRLGIIGYAFFEKIKGEK